MSNKPVFGHSLWSGWSKWKIAGLIVLVAVAGIVYMALKVSQSERRSSPIIVEGLVISSGNVSELYAIDAATGRERWNFDVGEFIESTPVASGDTVFVQGLAGPVYALDVATGRERWRSTSKSPSADQFSYPLKYYDGIIYATWSDGPIEALDASTGQRKWLLQAENDDFGATSPIAVSRETAYVSNWDGTIWSIDPQSGRPSEEYSDDSLTGLTPSFEAFVEVLDDVLYTAGSTNNLLALDTGTGNLKWVFEAKDWIMSPPSAEGGNIYFSSLDKRLYAVDADSGREKWHFKTAGKIIASPTVFRGVVYIGSMDSNVYAIDASSGKEIWHRQVAGNINSCPAVDNERVVVSTDNHEREGSVYSLDLDSGKIQWVFKK